MIINGPYLLTDSASYNGVAVYAVAQPTASEQLTPLKGHRNTVAFVSQ